MTVVPRTLRARLVGLIAALIGMISLFIFLYFPAQLKREAERSLLAKAQTIGRMTAFSVSAALVFRDAAGIREALAGALQNPDLSFIVVTDSSRAIVGGYNQTAAEGAAVVAASAAGGAIVRDSLALASVPIEANGRVIGRLEVGLSLRPMLDDVGRTRAAIALVTLLVFLSGVSAVVGISIVLTRPLAAIGAAVEAIAGGDASQRAPTSGVEEFAHLARAFNRMLDSLASSETRFRSLIEHSSDLVNIVGVDGRITYSSPSASRLLGYDPGELVGQVAFDYVHPEDVPRIQAAFRRALLLDSASVLETFRFRHREGSWLALESVVTNMMAVPSVAGMVVNSRDVTDRSRAEEALRHSEAEYRGLVEHSPLGIYRATPEGRFLTVNPALIKMLGYERAEELANIDISQDVYALPEDRSKLLAQFGQRDEAWMETQWKRKDGRLVTVRLISRVVRGPAGHMDYFEGLVEDVTEQRSLESQYRQAQKMDSIGRLAGGVAHDFNNILTAIVGYSDLLLEELSPDDPKRPEVVEIKAAGMRAAALTRQLLAFSRKQVIETRVLDLNEIVQTLDNMLRRLIGEDVTLELSLAPALGAVRADPGQIEQVILNFAVNARDAMPKGGRLTIETANVELDEAYAREHAGASPGQYALLAVSDTGTGMDAETSSHIFEPFFTTKELGQGTGLGLATVYGIVKQSGGYVGVYSEPGRGATFKVYLPRVAELAEAKSPVASTKLEAGGSETVLIAEDDQSVREIVATVLAQQGYRVLQAPEGRTALEMARAQPGEIHLLVTDLVMPGMTGRELAEALIAARPGVRVLYMSGYTDDAVVRHGVLTAGVPFLQKPFTARALASKVREVLNRP